MQAQRQGTHHTGETQDGEAVDGGDRSAKSSARPGSLDRGGQQREHANEHGSLDEYLELAKLLPEPPADAWLSLDLSHLAVDVDPAGVADCGASRVGSRPCSGWHAQQP